MVEFVKPLQATTVSDVFIDCRNKFMLPLQCSAVKLEWISSRQAKIVSKRNFMLIVEETHPKYLKLTVPKGDKAAAVKTKKAGRYV